MARLTVLQARAEVARQLQILDVDGSPELVATITSALATAQRTLAVLEPWLLPVRPQRLSAISGRAWYPVPCPREGVQAVGWQQDGSRGPRYLTPGLALDDLGGPAGSPVRFGIRPTYGVVAIQVAAGGSGYMQGQTVICAAPDDATGWTATGTATVTAGAITGVTLTTSGGGYAQAPAVQVDGGSGAALTAVLEEQDCIQLTPTPDMGGTLCLEWRPVPSMFLTDTDHLLMDDLAVILTAAAAVGPGANSPRATAVAADAPAYIQGLRRRGQPSAGGSFGFGSNGRR